VGRSHPVIGLLVSFLVACSGGKGGETDAATDAPDADDGMEIEEPQLPEPPEPPALPVLTPCPDGWREVEDPDTGIVTCDPWPSGGPEECGVDEAHFPGGSGCERIGTACPTGDWADDLPTDRTILYVRAGGPSGGDGTIGSPFGLISEAMAVADPLDVVAVSKGTFDEIVALRPAVTLWGACVAETIVASSISSDTGGTITVGGPDTEVRNLTIGGERSGVWVQGSGRTVVIEDVVIADARVYGVLADSGGQVTCRSVAVRDVDPGATSATGTIGRGIYVQDGGSVEVLRGVIERSMEVGILVSGIDSTAILHDVAVWDRLGERWFNMGRGLVVDSGARAEVARSVFERHFDDGVLMTHQDSSVEMTDVVVRGAWSETPDGQAGEGILVRGGALSITRGLVVGNRDSGVRVTGSEVVIEMVDVVVSDTQGLDVDGVSGLGMSAWHGAEVRVTRGAFLRNTYGGVMIIGEGASVDLTDVTVQGTLGALRDATFGAGLLVTRGGTCAATRLLSRDNRTFGIAVADEGTELVITDVTVVDTRSEDAWGDRGIGLMITQGARVELTRGSIENSRFYGILMGVEGTHAILSEVTISDTLERECVTGICEGFGGGTGIGVMAGAHADLSSFVITQSVLCGVQLAYGVDDLGRPYETGGTIDLHDGEISHNAVGVNVQTEGFDVERLMDGVVYIDNGTNLDMSELPVPGLGL